jgi:hypothetical protein
MAHRLWMLTLLLGLTAGCCATQEQAPAQAPAARTSPRVRALLVEYRDTLLAAEKDAESMYRTGTMDYGALGGLRMERLRAELELAETPEARIAILTALFEGARDQETLLQGRFEAELASNLELLAAKAMRLKAEIALEREKSRAPGP